MMVPLPFRSRSIRPTVAPLLLCSALLTGCSSGGGHPTTAHPAVSVAHDPRDLPPPIQRREPALVEVDLEAREVVTELSPGRKALVWTFNGTIPGPLIRARVGDTLAIRIHDAPMNHEPHSIDLHAVIGPGGGDKITEVEPGESAEARFKLQRPGTFLYHCAAEGMPWEHVAYGMYGAIVVEPEEGLPVVDRELYVAQSEWYLRPAKGEHGLDETVAVLDEEAAVDARPTLFTFNGNREALVSATLFGEAMRVPQGGTTRLFFASAGPNLGSSLHVVGAVFDRVYPSGFASSGLRDEETVFVPAGSAVTVEWSSPVPGRYTLVDHALFHASQGAVGFFHVDPTTGWPDDLYSPNPSGHGEPAGGGSH